MTEIMLKYNPIQIRADITIDGDEIAKTSNLYRYRNTPLEDWVDVLIPELVDYSNDDNIRIEICSLQKYIDEINKAIRVYEKKHRHVDIEVVENPSTGYKGRLNKLSQMIETLNIESGVSEIATYPFDVIVVSLADEDDYEEVLTNVFPDLDVKADKAILISSQECEEDGFEYKQYEIKDFEDRHIDARILVFPSLNECSNKYWRLLKEKVNGDGEFILVSVLNSKPKKNDELFDYIAEQLEKKGKINRSRFVFISDNPEDNLDYIQDEYGVKLNEMLDYDNADEIVEYVKSYIQNVCYVRKIKEQSSYLKRYLESMQEDISREAERTKSCEEAHTIMADYKRLSDAIVAHYESLTLMEYGSHSSESATSEFIEVLSESIKDFMVDEVIKSMAKLKEGINIDSATTSALSGILGAAFYGANSTGISTAYALLDPFSNGSRENDIMVLTEAVLNDFLVSYLSEHFSLVARNEAIIAEGIILQKEYLIQGLIKDKIGELCQKYIKQLSGIEKKTENGKKMGFFAWVTENITRSDIGLYSYSKTYLDYDNNNYSEMSKKIKRRLKTIEINIELIFSNAFKELGFDVSSEILESKIDSIKDLADASAKRVESKCSELLSQMEISSSDKGKIDGIGNLIAELEEIISL